MIADVRDVVTLGADVGGKDADVATADDCMVLRKLLKGECHGPYSSIVKEFALVLRIDGEIQSWCKRGVDNVRIQKKSGYATADIFVPTEIWRSTDKNSFRCFLAAEVLVAVRRIAERALNAKLTIESERLLNEVESATRKFLS